MWEVLNQFLQAFIPLFVAIDVVGVLPLFVNLTQDFTYQKRRGLISQAVVTALCVSLLFLIFGKLIFSFLRISENDFRVAGGLVLLVISISDLAYSTLQRLRAPETDDIGVVPIGIPLIVGPAALTTILIVLDNSGFVYTLMALLSNLVIVWWVFQKSDWMVKILGRSGARAIGKVMSLFLAAIAVMMIRVGLSSYFQ